MIDTQTQLDLFKLISRKIKADITAYAFGGTAMMFYGYKTATKDVDLVFKTEKDMKDFIMAIEELGYSEMSMKGIYSYKKARQKNKPKIYSRGDERFDLFVKKIFGTELTRGMAKRIYARHDFIHNEKTLFVNVLSKEDIILLKAVTERENDFDDIITIVEKERDVDWDYIVDSAIEQKKLGNSWIIIDLEKTMQRLREHTLIRKKYFDRLYGAID